ncbi:MAG TPA: hypothetical protein VN943_05955 [Candidatus Acidoferrum sp.]|nr:hypothetical protein [Candidatus Acidoferrum sp.]
MKIGICMTLFLLGSAQAGWGQTEERFAAPGGEEKAADAPENSYTVLGATPREEALVREQISVMHPEVLPLRVLFVPHWKYTGATKAFRLHVPTGFTSAMFTHLASRSVFIDADRYVSEDSLGYWLAHELGHLATNSVKENDAERAAREYRKRLKEAGKRNVR